MKEKPKFKWRMERECDNCPFAHDGPGAHLRESLGPKRWASIIQSLLDGAPFMCHKTSNETGDGSNVYCFGALKFQNDNKIETSYMTLCRGMEGANESKRTMFKRLKQIMKGRTK